MKVLLVANTGWYLYNFRLPLARFLSEQGLEIVLVSPRDDYTERLQRAGFRWRPIHLDRKGTDPLREARSLRELVHIYRDERPDAVHHFTIKCVLYGTAAARWTGVPAIVNAVTGLGHAFTGRDLKSRLLRPFIRGLYRWLLPAQRGVVIFQNPDDRDTLIELGAVEARNTALIRSSGVNMHRFKPPQVPPAAQPPVVLFVGRLTRDKGLVELVEAARILKAEGRNLRFRVCGAPDEAGPSGIPAAQLEAWRSEGAVELVGHVDDISLALAEASVVVLPSHGGEGVPRSLVEAAAMEKALVTTDVPGCREVVRHRHNGLLVPVADSGALAVAIAELLDDPGLRDRMGRESRRSALEAFSEEHVLDATAGVYRRLGVLPHADPAAAIEPQGRTRLFFLIRDLRVGGAQRQLSELVKHLDKARFEVTVATFYPGGALRDELACVPEVKLISLDKRGRWDVLPFLWRLEQAAKKARPHIIHGYMDVANVLSLALGKWLGARVAWGIRASAMDQALQGSLASLVSGCAARLSPWADLIIANSQAGRHDHVAAGYCGARMQVIPNGIDTERFRPDADARQAQRARWGWSSECWGIGLVGRLDPMKDHPTFLRAAQRFAALHSQARFVCIGQGDERYGKQLRALAEQLGLATVLCWEPSSRDLRAAYCALDLLALTSVRGEGFPNVIGEAMACGTLVVTTDTGDAGTIVGDATRVVARGDVTSLVKAWEAAFALPAPQRAGLQDAGRTRIAAELSTRQLAQRTEAALSSLLR